MKRLLETIYRLFFSEGAGSKPAGISFFVAFALSRRIVATDVSCIVRGYRTIKRRDID